MTLWMREGESNLQVSRIFDKKGHIPLQNEVSRWNEILWWKRHYQFGRMEIILIQSMLPGL